MAAAPLAAAQAPAPATLPAAPGAPAAQSAPAAPAAASAPPAGAATGLASLDETLAPGAEALGTLDAVVAADALGSVDTSRDPPARVGRLSAFSGKVALRAGAADAGLGQGDAAAPGDVDGELPSDVAGGPGSGAPWLAAERNRPMVPGDSLWVGPGSRAEVHLGSVAARLGPDSVLQLLVVDDAHLRLALQRGSLDVRVPASVTGDGAGDVAGGTVDVLTPGLRAELAAPGSYRLDVDAAGALVALRVGPEGNAELASEDATLRVSAGQAACNDEASGSGLRLRDAPARDALDRWADAQAQAQSRAPALRYVSANLVGYQDLDAYGTWTSSPSYGPLWAPRQVGADWAPFRYGHWAYVLPWGWTWVDDAPWGFAPFHYGRWVHLQRRWYWAPGAYAAWPTYAPHLVAFAGGAPGGAGVGVGVGNGAGYISWVPLGFTDPFWPAYPHSYAYARGINGARPWRGRGPHGQAFASTYAGAVTQVPQQVVLGGVGVGGQWRVGVGIGVGVGVGAGTWGSVMPLGAPMGTFGGYGYGVGVGVGPRGVAGPPPGARRGPVLGPGLGPVRPPGLRPGFGGRPPHPGPGPYRALPAYRYEPHVRPHGLAPGPGGGRFAGHGNAGFGGGHAGMGGHGHR